MDRGWRRSGQLLYLPDNRRSCCPHYTIRLPIQQFKPSRDQRQTLNRWNRYILGDSYEKEFGRKHAKFAQERRRTQNGFDLYSSVHASETNKLYHEAGKALDPLPAHEYEVTLEKDSFTEEKYALYKKYQIAVHKDKPADVTASGFKRFLCGSPIIRTSDAGTSTSTPYGSYHQTHRVDGELIAMSVLDVLPSGVSAVYFIYHPDYHKHALGKVSALREASLAVDLGVENYYMGYYIHSCPKMRYKGDYRPQFVLDLSRLNAAAPGQHSALCSDEHVAESTTSAINAWRLLDDEVKAEMNAGTYGLGDISVDELKTPSEAAASGLSLLQLSVPGVMPLEQLRSELDLGQVRLSLQQFGDSFFPPVSILQAWSGGLGNDSDEDDHDVSEFLDARSLKGVIAELAAAVGIDVARCMAVNFG